MSQNRGFFLGVTSSSKLLLVSDVTSGFRVGVPGSENQIGKNQPQKSLEKINTISKRQTRIADNGYIIEKNLSYWN